MLELVPANDAILTTMTSRFDFDEPPFNPIIFSQELVKTMWELNGIGIAANQVGQPYSIFALRGSPQNFVCFNPKVVWSSETEVTLEEGCLTYPGFFVKIKRPQHVRLRFHQPNGEVRTELFTGLTARCVLHEMDHLNGIKFYSRASRYHREAAFKKWKEKSE